MILRWLSKAMLPATTANACAAAVGCTVAATIARAAINPLLPPGVPYFTFWIAVDVATVIAGWRAGVVTVLVGAIIGWYIWLPPTFSFQLLPGNLTVIVVFLILASLQVLLAEMMRTAVFRLEQATEGRELVVSELSHRLKNQLAVFSSIASSTLRSTDDTQLALSKIQGRLVALSAALKLATANERQSILLGELIASVVKPLAPSENRLRLEGEAIEISGERGQSFALVFHELATNALKYGAWRGETGGVKVDWHSNNDDVTVTWTEDRQADAVASDSKGFGTMLIERAIDRSQVEILETDHARIVMIRAKFRDGESGIAHGVAFERPQQAYPADKGMRETKQTA